MEPEKYPIDVATLTKGHDIDCEVLGILTTPRDSSRRSLELLMIRDEIQRQADGAGICVSLIVKGHHLIRVQTDSEAAQYHDRQSRNAVRKLGRQAHMLRANVDRSRLTDEEKESHARAVARRGMQYLAAKMSLGRQLVLTGKTGKKFLEQVKDRQDAKDALD
jgi:hypothetical protein